MQVGKDFDKIEWNFFGMHLLEPNALIGDTLILIVSLVLWSQIKGQGTFYKNWKLFYLYFGISFFLGGLGHLFYNYTGLLGKCPSWFLGMYASYRIEKAMISIYPIGKISKRLRQMIWIKLNFFYLAEILILSFANTTKDPSIGLLIPTLSSVLGLGFALGYLAPVYSKQYDSNFKYLWYGALMLLPNVLIQGLKINISPWFDRNDLSHILLLGGILLYIQSIRKVIIPKEIAFSIVPIKSKK